MKLPSQQRVSIRYRIKRNQQERERARGQEKYEKLGKFRYSREKRRRCYGKARRRRLIVRHFMFCFEKVFFFKRAAVSMCEGITSSSSGPALVLSTKHSRCCQAVNKNKISSLPRDPSQPPHTHNQSFRLPGNKFFCGILCICASNLLQKKTDGNKILTTVQERFRI